MVLTEEIMQFTTTVTQLVIAGQMIPVTLAAAIYTSGGIWILRWYYFMRRLTATLSMADAVYTYMIPRIIILSLL